KEYIFYHDMLISGGYAYLSSDYTEGAGSIIRSNLTLMNTKEIIMDRALQQSTNRIATDGVRLYSGGRKDFQETVSYVQAATFDNIGNFNNYLSFQGATVQIFSNTFKVTDIVE